MSSGGGGAEAAFVISLISGVISIIDATKKVFDAAKDAKGYPEAFREVAARMPTVIQILHNAETSARTIDETAEEALESLFKSCKAKAENIHEIFQKVLQKTDDKWHDRYRKAVKAVAKGSKVETLMGEIIKDVQLLACEQLTGIATDDQLKELRQGIEEMNEMPSSLEEETGTVTQTHSGSGDNIGHSGPGNIYAGDAHHNQNTGDVNYGNHSIEPSFTFYYGNQGQDPILEDRGIEENILQYLRFPTLEARYEGINPAHAKTYNWVFEGFKSSSSSSLSDWLEGKGEDGGLFWVYGKAGSGKSTLMKYIYDDNRTEEKLAKWAGGQGLTIASFFFWISGTADQCSQTGFLRSVLHHLLQQHRHLIREVFPDLWEALKISNTKISITLRAWSLSYASKALKNLLGHDLGKVVLFIDGLDEYHGDYGDHLSPESPKNYIEIINLVKSLSSPNIKICFSSRPLQIFHNHFDGQPKLRLQDLTWGDIYTYAKDKLVDDPTVVALRSRHDGNLLDLVSRIVFQAEGVFLWVILVVRSLLNGIHNSDGLEELEKQLDHTPSDVMKLYRYMLEQIQPYYRAEGSKIFAMADSALIITQKQDIGWTFSGSRQKGPCMISMWFGLEYSKLNGSEMGHLQNIPSDREIAEGVSEIDRKLKTRCAGLLEAGLAMPTAPWVEQDWDRLYEYVPETRLKHREMQWDQLYEWVLETKFGNRKVQYIHRSAKEFLDMEETNAFLQSVTPLSFDPKISLIWSALQQIRFYRPHQSEPTWNSETVLFCPAESALLLARSIQDEGKICPVGLLDLLNYNIQSKQSQQEFSWVAEAIHEIYSHNHPLRPTELYSKEAYPQLRDDFLSLAIMYGLSDYVESKITEQPLIVKQKRGRPYLDYSLAIFYNEAMVIYPKIIQMLLRAGANPDENYCIIHSIPGCELSNDAGTYAKSGCNIWTPWQSALESILWAGKVEWPSDPLDLQQRQTWIEVLKYLLDKGPDVSVETWFENMAKPDEPYTVSGIISFLSARDFPEEAHQLLLKAENLARIQGCTL